MKGLGFEKVLKERLKELNGIKSAYLFGSYARDNLSVESDIDILIVGTPDVVKLQKALLEIQQLTGREINSVEMTEKEFKQRIKKKDPFLEDVFSKKHIKIL